MSVVDRIAVPTPVMAAASRRTVKSMRLQRVVYTTWLIGRRFAVAGPSGDHPMKEA
jgi:hypothetical protein